MTSNTSRARRNGALPYAFALTLAPCLQAADATRSSGAKATEFQELYDYDAEAKTLSNATFPYEVQVHRAPVVMQVESGIVTHMEAAAIARPDRGLPQGRGTFGLCVTGMGN